MGNINQTKSSANRDWSDLEFKKTHPFPKPRLTIIDQTDDGNHKRVVVYIQNSASGEQVTPVWKSFDLANQNKKYFTFPGSYFLEASVGETHYSNIFATLGRKYQTDNGNLVDFAAASFHAERQVVNNTDEDMSVSITSGGDIIQTKTLTPDQTATFEFLPRFYIGITEDFDSDPDIEEINTEISVLGVSTADIVVTNSGDVFSFSLSNVTYS